MGASDINRPPSPKAQPTGGSHAAALTAAVVLLTSGLGFRSLDRYLTHPTESIPLEPGTLATVPLQIATWRGEDVPLDDAVRQATDTDALLNRRYVRRGGEVVGFYLAYGVRSRDLMPHRPEVCYPAAGWSLTDKAPLELALPDGTQLPCRVMQFARAGFDLQKMTVLNYYIVDGHICPDVSLLRSRVWWGSRGAQYTVQVQVTCWGTAGRQDPDARRKAVASFAVDSFEAIRSVLPSCTDASAAPVDLQQFGRVGR